MDHRELQVEFGDIHEKNLQQLRKLNSSIFPVRYNDKYYNDVLRTPREFTQYAFLNGFVIGAICCRVEPLPDEGGSSLVVGAPPQYLSLEAAAALGGGRLYIMTLGVLAAYRSRGVGAKMLRLALANLERYPQLREIYLHVQTSNGEALRFYERFGFERGELILNYYKRIEPPDCYLLRWRRPASEVPPGLAPGVDGGRMGAGVGAASGGPKDTSGGGGGGEGGDGDDVCGTSGGGAGGDGGCGGATGSKPEARGPEMLPKPQTRAAARMPLP